MWFFNKDRSCIITVTAAAMFAIARLIAPAAAAAPAARRGYSVRRDWCFIDIHSQASPYKTPADHLYFPPGPRVWLIFGGIVIQFIFTACQQF